MADKSKTPADANLIKKLFNLDPLDWARYPDESLVFIAPDGSKARYTKEQLEEIAASNPQAKPKENSESANLPAEKTTANPAGTVNFASPDYPQESE